MADKVIMITGTRKGIGKYLAHYYAKKDYRIVGCSRQPADYEVRNYEHFCLDVSDEEKTRKMFLSVQKKYGRLDILINNAGRASMNHFLLTPIKTVRELFETNYVGTFLFAREAAKLMKRKKGGRIVNFSTVAVPMKLEGEAVYASLKAAIESLTRILAKELSDFGITVNAIGPAPVETDLIRNVPKEKISSIKDIQAIHRLASYEDISNVIDFFIDSRSDFITGQVIYLGGP
jgi:3-oxoacyl-[acyl-carrier protein] reductase